MSLILKNVCLPLAPFTLEADVEIGGRITAIFGPSGSGKTSLLELVAGWRQAKSAFIQLDDRVLTDVAQGVSVPVRQREIGYVPQDLALFPHMSVRKNLLYSHKAVPTANRQGNFERVVGVLEIQPLLARSVTELSGGEKQRVALGRALLAAPRLLLLDEPLASLDHQLKIRIIPYLATIRDEFRVPMLYVTHDRFETLALADEMVVMVNGRIAQTGSVREVFSRPANVAVAGLLTVETIQPGRIVNVDGDLVSVAVGSTRVAALAQSPTANAGEVHVCIRAEDVILLKGGDSQSSARNHLPAVVQSVARDGLLVRVELDCGFPLTAVVTRQSCEELALGAGARVVALVKAPHIHLIPRDAARV
jgi:molybdate transport system ATP-binding protein